ncbi:MAG: glycosyltransferase family 39 protein [bacterium]|nr:glycosyltransferase family 39 protein [bacterium]
MKKEHTWLLLILVVGILFRFYRFSSPIADWHSWRQADTSSVSRIYSEQGFDLLHPRFHDLSNVPSGLDNPQGYRFVEFPLYNILQAGFYGIFGVLTLEEWGRIVTIMASSISALLIFLIVRKHAESNVALGSAFFFAILPYSIYYGRVILPDPLMVTTTLSAIYFFDRWLLEKTEDKTLQSKNFAKIYSPGFFLLSVISAAAALLLKPFAAFFFLPIVVLAFNAFGLRLLRRWQLYVYTLVAFLPLLSWRWWMLRFPEGIPVSDWLFNGGNIRFKGAFFYWIFGDHLGKEMLGFAGYTLLLLGIMVVASSVFMRREKSQRFFLSFLVASLLYVFVVARGNVQHDYYQIPLLPTVAIFFGFGAAFLYKPVSGINRVGGMTVLLFSVAFSFFLSWYTVRDFFNINNPNIVTAGEMVDRLTPKDAKILTFYNGDTSFLYQTKRQGWASLEKPLLEMIQMGAQYVAIVNPTQQDVDGLGNEYQIVASDPKFLIIKLTK